MKRVVTIGGGTGSYMLLSGLKHFPLDITAVVTMFDSGGSAGALRDQFGILPPGDVRRCLVALSEGEREQILRNLFSFRFDNAGSELHGHSFGNLFILALSTMYHSDVEAIRKASELLNIRGKVLPVSINLSHLVATLADGSIVRGETNIDIPRHDTSLRIVDLALDPPADMYPETEESIRAADMIVVCPGDLYSSLAPNFLVTGMKHALLQSSAKKVAVCNLMTKGGETNGYAVEDFVRELSRYSGIGTFDYVLCNTAAMDEELVAAYAREDKYPMVYNGGLERLARHVVEGNFYSDADIARHDPMKIAQTIAAL